MAGGQVLRAEMPPSIGVRRESLLIDLVHLSKYTLGERALECELLGLFKAQAGVYLARMQAADCVKTWTDAAHTLKGSARGVGAWAVADQAELAEALRNPEGAARDDALMMLEAAIDETVAHIRLLMDE
ncbi:MAG: Hpt domain-containing protein [Rhodobiaceae bacterium]|nr:Hpt domain-containing protein [Rhodobiaceae bacterium]